MGNRATVTTRDKDLGLYLHWFGGIEEVLPVLAYCKLHQYRPPERDGYGWARLSQVFGNYIGGTLSMGMYRYERLPLAMDNGEYVIENWEIVEHDGPGGISLPPEYDMRSKLHKIDERMPQREQLGSYIDSEVIPIEEVEVGMSVWLWEAEEPQLYTVVGFGPEEAGEDLRGRPYVNRIPMPTGELWRSALNYLTDDHVRAVRQGDWTSKVMVSMFGKPISDLR